MALVQAGQKLFAERPIEVVSIDDIVQAAEVGRGSFYNHFADKEQFEREILAEARREMEAAIGAATHGEPDPALRTVLAFCVSIRFGHEHPDRARMVTRQFIWGGYMQSELNQGLLNDISDGILARRFSVPTAEIGLLTVLGLAAAAMIRSMEMADLLTKLSLAQQIGVAILRALGMQGDEPGTLSALAAEATIRPGRRHPPAEPAERRPT
jgi:AcrR family transcriptional regulator